MTTTVLPPLHQAVQHAQQNPSHVLEVEAGRGLVKDVHGVRPVERFLESSEESFTRWASPP